jgi:hypothetical protein
MQITQGSHQMYSPPTAYTGRLTFVLTLTVMRTFRNWTTPVVFGPLPSQSVRAFRNRGDGQRRRYWCER